MNDDRISEDKKEELVSAARTTVGDELRSMAYFTDEAVEQLYLREDLEEEANLVGFAENERLGFRSQTAYRETELGNYRFTIRVFDHGYLTRIISDDHGVWVTTDAMSIDRFEELADALGTILEAL